MSILNRHYSSLQSQTTSLNSSSFHSKLSSNYNNNNINNNINNKDQSSMLLGAVFPANEPFHLPTQSTLQPLEVQNWFHRNRVEDFMEQMKIGGTKLPCNNKILIYYLIVLFNFFFYSIFLI